ncbi:MAG: hypothetical protein LBM61_05700 [Prevotellaceae bacterium]|jgi:hypothetical protein|nr:hypothetical protein [Prevotellaceae bacterium]
MGMFRPQMPRRFHHEYIYHDERKEKLDQMREKAKRELGIAPEKPFSPEDIRGKFFEQTTHVKRRRESKFRVGSTAIILVALLLLVVLFRYLLKGQI